jgi:AcrR family transcriptional regulator
VPRHRVATFILNIHRIVIAHGSTRCKKIVGAGVPRTLSEREVAVFRQRICVAAERLFAAHGPAAISMRQLGAELGVTSMTLYRYYKDKDDILAAVRARAFDRIAEALERGLAESLGPSDQGAPVAAAYIDFAFKNPAAYRLMFELTQANEADYPDLVRASSRARDTLRAFVEHAIAVGLFEDERPDVVAHAYWAAIHGLVVLQLAGKLGPTVSFDAVRKSIFGALARGFHKQAPGREKRATRRKNGNA